MNFDVFRRLDFARINFKDPRCCWNVAEDLRLGTVFKNSSKEYVLENFSYSHWCK